MSPLRKLVTPRVRVSMPLTTSIAITGMVAGAGLIVVSYVQSAGAAGSGPSGVSVVVFLTVVLAGTSAMPLLAAWGLSRGKRWAPLLVTTFGIWSCALLVSYRDLLTWVSVVVSVIALVAVWMPSARKFGRDRRGIG
jgi:uncharacterized membrane protein